MSPAWTEKRPKPWTELSLRVILSLYQHCLYRPFGYSASLAIRLREIAEYTANGRMLLRFPWSVAFSFLQFVCFSPSIFCYVLTAPDPRQFSEKSILYERSLRYEDA